MGAFAFSETDGSVGIVAAELVLWGAVAAAAVCAFVVLLDGAAVIAWAAIGYVLFGALLTVGSPHWPLAAPAPALLPLLPRPNRSPGLGLLVPSAAAPIAPGPVGLLA